MNDQPQSPPPKDIQQTISDMMEAAYNQGIDHCIDRIEMFFSNWTLSNQDELIEFLKELKKH